MARSREADFGS